MKNINLTGKEFDKAKQYIDEYKAEYNEALSEKENKINFILKNFPDKTKEEAKKIVVDLYEGCSEYMKNLEEALNDKKFSIKEAFSEKLADLPVEEKYALAANLILVVQAIDNSVIAENTDEEHLDMKKKIEELLNSNLEVAPGTINQEDLEKILSELDEAINNTAFGFYGCEQMLELVKNNNDGDTVAFVENYWKNEEYKATASMGAYIAYLKGEIPEAQEGISAGEMAVMVSAGIDKDAVIKEFSAGRIALEYALKILGVIGVIALACLMVYTIIKFVSLAVGFGSLVFAGLFGGGLIAILAGAFFGGAFAVNTVNWISDHIEGAGEKIGEYAEIAKEKILSGYEKVTGYVKNTVAPKIKEGAKKTWNFINDRIIAGVVRAYRAFKNNENVAIL